MNLWRAGCVGTRTSGSESGSGKRTSPKGGHRAPARLYREVFRQPFADAVVLLDGWLKWTLRSRLAPFIEVARMVLDQMEAIEATLYLGLTSARVEAINTHLRLIARRAYGFHSPDAMIALAMLRCGSIRPMLPGRAA
jgi:transposase